tara:strand:+ start:2765 stop:3706 length:942 start_codon:yes stop_codon:yes gene_type:complete
MNQIQSFKFYIFFIILSFVLPLELKPSNSNELIKINVDGKNRTYYHLEKNKELIYSFDNEGIKDLSQRFSLKVVSRTVIASNSNSNKTFGINIDVFDGDQLVDSQNVTYNKDVSNATSDAKPGWNYTKAGFWFQELNDLENKTMKITLMKGSPGVEVKLLLEKINLRISEKELSPINKVEKHNVIYNDEEGNSITSKNWYLLTDSNILQFKISGPKMIRFISRVVTEDDDNENQMYSFLLREDGRYISNYNHSYKNSKSNAVVKGLNERLSSYNSSFYNIPKGIHYYSFISNDENNFSSNDIYLKLEVYNESE